MASRLLSGGGDGCGYEHTGGAVLLAAPMASLLIGALVAHISSRFVPSLPYTPTLALIGVIVACVAANQGECAHMRGSVQSWIWIDGHALLFLFLPPLLFSDTMHIDWNLAKASLGQCLVLAGPGVLIGSFLHVLYGTMLPYGWSFSLSLAFGAVQAATDPVAVVSLLSALGAPVTLTMIISGESLLNDGTAIVVWNVAFYSYLGYGKNAATYSVKLIFGGLGIGIAFWLFVLFWMSKLNRRHGHTDGTIQIALTVFACYTCFYVAEGVCEVSGVLAVVAMGVGLGATFWPLICNKETMQHVWHIFEWLLNTFLFQLCGLIIGARLVHPMATGTYAFGTSAPGSGYDGSGGGGGGAHLRELAEAGSIGITGTDVGYAVMTWMVGLLIRGVVLAVSYPALRRMGYGLTRKDAVTCWWGGLHGGVGLALAMAMEGDLRESGEAQQGMRVLLHVSVAAMLTLLVNAPLMAPLLKGLGLTATSAIKQSKFKDMKGRVNAYAWAEYSKLLAHGKFTPSSAKWRDAVPNAIHLMSATDQRRGSLIRQAQAQVAAEGDGALHDSEEAAQPAPSMANVDQGKVMEARGAFLTLVLNSYTAYLEEGIIPSRSSLNVDLVASISYAKDHIDQPLADWTRLATLALKLPALMRWMAKCKCLKPEALQDNYAAHVAFALTSFIGAHEEAREELKWMFGKRDDSLNAEMAVVLAESEACVYKAKTFLYEMHCLVTGRTTSAASGGAAAPESDTDDVIDYVKARQVASVLLIRIVGYINRLHRRGVLEGWMAEELLHDVEHDEVSLPTHLKKAAMGKDGTLLGGGGEILEQLNALYAKLMSQEGVDISKKTVKEKLDQVKKGLQNVKHLPGAVSSTAVDVDSVRVGEQAAPPPPPPGGASAAGAASRLPPGWTVTTTADGQTYYVNDATGQASWTPPAM